MNNEVDNLKNEGKEIIEVESKEIEQQPFDIEKKNSNKIDWQSVFLKAKDFFKKFGEKIYYGLKWLGNKIVFLCGFIWKHIVICSKKIGKTLLKFFKFCWKKIKELGSLIAKGVKKVFVKLKPALLKIKKTVLRFLLKVFLIVRKIFRKIGNFAFHQIKIPEIKRKRKGVPVENRQQFEINYEKGLTRAQVSIRNTEHLTNSTVRHVTKSYAQIFSDNILTFFNLVLAVLAFMMIYIKAYGSLAFFWILLINITVGIFQDVKARILIDKLQIISEPKIKILRNGHIRNLSTKHLVVDDLYFLKTGDQIPTDSEVFEDELEVNESLLTGESDNVLKKPGDMLYAGSYVVSGNAKCIVRQVGADNYAEKLQAKAKNFTRVKSEVMNSLNSLLRVLASFVIILGSTMFITYAIQQKLVIEPHVPIENTTFGSNVKKIVGSLVTMIPSGMFLLTSLAFTVGIINLARKRVLVQDLYCIESLARIDTLCLDKTGTITDGSMKIIEILPLAKVKVEYIKEKLITLVNATKDDNATAKAILNDCSDFKPLLETVTDVVPFNSKYKYSAYNTEKESFVLGAKEFVGIDMPILNNIAAKFERQGERVLLLGRTKKTIKRDEPLVGVEPVAFIVFEDHIRSGAIDNIKWFKDNKVTIKVISGDNALTVSKIAYKVGVEDAENYVSLEGMSIEDVKDIANDYTVFGRVTPEQKAALVEAMQSEEHIVGMTGDGVNDILALKKADCSVAMAGGSAAARNAANIVSLDNDFNVFPQIVAEGRKVVNNLQKACSLYLCKTLFAIALTLSFIIASWANPSTVYPYETNNMYVWELLTIGVGSFALTLEPNTQPIEGHFLGNLLKKALPGGVAQIFGALGVLAFSYLFPEALVYEDAVSISIAYFTIFSFFILGRACTPFDTFKAVMIPILAAIAMALAIIDWRIFYAASGSAYQEAAIFKFNYSVFGNYGAIIVLATMLLIGVLVFFGVEFLCRDLGNKKITGDFDDEIL